LAHQFGGGAFGLAGGAGIGDLCPGGEAGGLFGVVGLGTRAELFELRLLGRGGAVQAVAEALFTERANFSKPC
jgi:hypothetical protein